MNFQEQIEVLERLSALDAELKELNDELSRERDALTAKRERLTGLQGRSQASRASLVDMEKLRNEYMLELRQMANQLDRAREKLARTRNEREANAAQREVEETRKLLRDREIEIEKLAGLAEQARDEIENVENERDSLGASLGEEQGDVEGRLSAAEASLAAKEAERADLVARIVPATYRRYELVRKRRGSGLAHTVKGKCSACHILLSPMDFQRIQRATEFTQCASCNRLLYFRRDAEPAGDRQPGAT